MRLAFLLTGSREQGEDIVHGVLASAMPRWHSIEQPFAYLKRAIVNQAANERRRGRRELAGARNEPVTHLPDIDEAWTAVRLLPAAQRAVVVLHYYEDLPLVTIADLLGRRASTVRSDLKRALDRLRKVIDR